MAAEGSVTRWIDELKAGNRDAAQPLWERYIRRVVGLARARLRDTPRGVSDEEDVALSAFDSFFRGAEQGRFPQLRDRDNLWHLLVTITARKVCHVVRDALRQKRGGGLVLNETALRDHAAGEPGEGELEQVLGREPTPAFAAEMAEECQRLLNLLPDEELRAIALGKMEGCTNEEIAAQLHCAPSTVERRHRLIRRLWGEERAS